MLSPNFESEHYVIPTLFVMAIEYDDNTMLDGDDIEKLNAFLADLTPGGFWEFSGTEYFSHTNDVDDKGHTVVDASYVWPIK